MHNVTDVNAFTSPVQVLDDGDPVAASQTQPTIQALANRTFYTNSLLALVRGMDVVASAGGTTVLTGASNRTQVLTGASAQSFKLPDETTLPVGDTFKFFNMSTGALTVKDSASSTLFVIQPHLGTNRAQYAFATSISAGATTGNWRFAYDVPGQLLATNTNDSAAVGAVGESYLLTTSSFSWTGSSPVNVLGPMPLTAGDWDISGMIRGAPVQFGVGISTTSATMPTNLGYPAGAQMATGNGSSTTVTDAIFPVYPAKLSGSTSLYMVISSGLLGSWGPVSGFLSARRAR
jgi:hypothetical protein